MKSRILNSLGPDQKSDPRLGEGKRDCHVDLIVRVEGGGWMVDGGWWMSAFQAQLPSWPRIPNFDTMGGWMMVVSKETAK